MLLILLHLVFATSESNIVKFLPGFQGPLPFVLETGYIEVSETKADENAEVFYYFIESENNPKQDPLLLWLTGGPGCSGFSGLAFEIGPITFTINEEYNGSLPNLALRPHSWTKAISNIIFLDLPAGTGFSYPKTETAVQQSTWKLVHNAHQFLRKEMIYILGNPLTTPKNNDYRIPFNHRMALISDELYLSLQKNCKGNYINIDPQNELCQSVFQSYEETISRVFTLHILEPKCESDYHKEVPSRRHIDKAHEIFSSSLTMPPSCRVTSQN
ncbi:unnamed protein product [Trifolium pratense]|uniref:Uncharacterized protein n=1 Tax=Trifolium pratense TaxID=57577 RepID=A0ACB0JBR5_TRIPR|nr:unnamed protein product [Trifolium pratense]